jgi:hypothetical protein
MEDMLQLVKHKLEEPGKMLNFYQLKSFLEKSFGSSSTKKRLPQSIQMT